MVKLRNAQDKGFADRFRVLIEGAESKKEV